jgi:uncharacterized protein with HEPN domain
LHTILESTLFITEEHQREHKYVPWSHLKRLRNGLVHDYLGTMDTDVLWSLCEKTVPKLGAACEDILNMHHTQGKYTGRGYDR